jgi:hypothetical protein
MTGEEIRTWTILPASHNSCQVSVIQALTGKAEFLCTKTLCYEESMMPKANLTYAVDTSDNAQDTAFLGVRLSLSL